MQYFGWFMQDFGRIIHDFGWVMTDSELFHARFSLDYSGLITQDSCVIT